NAGSGNATLTIGRNNASGGNFGGRIIDRTSGNGTVTLEKIGLGTITLFGTNRFDSLRIVGGNLIHAPQTALSIGNGSGSSVRLISGDFGSGAYLGTLDVSATESFSANVGTFEV